MAKARLASVEISFIAHATEDEKRLVSFIAQGFDTKQEVFRGQVLKGHYGNRVTLYTARLMGEEAERILLNITARLGPDGHRKLKAELAKSVDEHGHLYIRLDKQGLVRGVIRLGQADPVRVKAGLRGWVRGLGGEGWTWLFNEDSLKQVPDTGKS